MADDGKGNTKIAIIGTIIVALIGALGVMIASNSLPSNLQFIHNSIFGEPLIQEKLLVSNYHDMYLNTVYKFGAIVALDDSVKEARMEIPTGIIVTKGGIEYTKGNTNNTTIVSTNQSMLVGTKVDLSGANFKIEPVGNLSSRTQNIPHNNPGQNYAMWEWYVTPQLPGEQTLHVEAYTVNDKGPDTKINFTDIPIHVTVLSAPVSLTPSYVAPTNVTSANVTAPAAAPVTAQARKTPGFEGIFAITGLLAVAYLVLGRKQ